MPALQQFVNLFVCQLSTGYFSHPDLFFQQGMDKTNDVWNKMT